MAGSLLAWLCAPASTQVVGELLRDRTVRVHDVRDLLVEIREFPVRRFNQPETKAGGEVVLRGPSPRERLLKDLNAYLKSRGVSRRAYTLQLPIPSEVRVGEPPSKGSLIVNGTAPAHRAVEAFLDRERTLVNQFIHVTTRIFRIKDPEDALPGPLTDEPIGEKDTIYFLTGEQAGALVEALRESRNVVCVAAPRLTMLNRQRSNVVVCNQLAYVAEYQRVKVLGQESSVLDPVIRKVDEGVAIEVKVALEPDDMSRARVEVFYQNAELERPIARKKSAYGEIQVPRIESVDLEFDANIALPGHLLLTSRARPKLGVDLVLLSFARQSQEEVWKGEREVSAPVIGVSPAPVMARGPDDTPSGELRVFVQIGTKAGLERGMEVRFHRKTDAAFLFAGRVEKVYDDLSIVKVKLSRKLPRIELREAGDWTCEFKVKHRKVKPGRKKL
jgi:hypothetical protein